MDAPECIYCNGTASSIAYFSVSSDDLGKTIEISSSDYSELLSFVRADTNGRVTFVITRLTTTNGLNTAFASKETTTHNPPRLFVTSEGTLGVTDDFHVRYNDSVSYGTASEVLVKRGGSNSRWGFLEFNLDAARDVHDATLYLDVSTYEVSAGSLPASTTFHVYGIKDDSSLENLSESSSYGTVSSFLELSEDGVIDSTVESLGSFTVTSADLGQTVGFTSTTLIDFIGSDEDGRLSLVIARSTDNGYFNTGFASRQHGTLGGPRLSLRFDHGDGGGAMEMKLVFKDGDGDGDEELVLVVTMPGGGAFVVTDPWEIALLLHKSGWTSSDDEFYETLSQTQKESLENTVALFDAPASGSGGAVTSDDLEDSFTVASAYQQYSNGYIAMDIGYVSGDVDIALEDMSFEVRAYSSAFEYAMHEEGFATAKISVLSTTDRLLVTTDGVAFGSAATLFSTTWTVERGTTFGYDISAGFYAELAWGRNNLYGFTLPVYGPFGVSLYIHSGDAIAAWNTMAGAVEDLGLDVADWTEGAWNSTVNWADGTYVIMADAVTDAVVWVEVTGTTAVVAVEQAGKKTVVWFAATGSDLTNAVGSAADSVVDDLETGSVVAVNTLESWVNSATGATANALSSAYSDATGWIVGSANTVGNVVSSTWSSVKKAFKFW